MEGPALLVGWLDYAPLQDLRYNSLQRDTRFYEELGCCPISICGDIKAFPPGRQVAECSMECGVFGEDLEHLFKFFNGIDRNRAIDDPFSNAVLPFKFVAQSPPLN
jgi:hypothetical protein